MIWSSILAVSVFLLFCPILFNINFFFNKSDNKLYMGIYLFNFIKIYGGYLQIFKKGIWLYLSDKKHFLLSYSDALKKNQSNMSILKGFDLIKIHAVIELGIKDEVPKAMMYVSGIHNLVSAVFSIIRTKNSAMSLKCTEILEENEDVLKITASIKYVFNIFLLLLAFIKIILNEVIKNVKRQRKQIRQHG